MNCFEAESVDFFVRESRFTRSVGGTDGRCTRNLKAAVIIGRPLLCIVLGFLLVLWVDVVYTLLFVQTASAFSNWLLYRSA